MLDGSAIPPQVDFRIPLQRRLASVGWIPDFVEYPERGQITLLMVGTQDLWQGGDSHDPDAVAHAPQNLNRLIENIYQKNAATRLYVASIPPIYDSSAGSEIEAVKKYNAAIPGIVSSWAARGKSIHFVDVYSSLSATDLIDGVQPSDAGHRKIAEAFFGAMVTVPEPGSGLLGICVAALLLRRKR